MCNPQKEDLEKLRIKKWRLEMIKKNLRKSRSDNNKKQK